MSGRDGTRGYLYQTVASVLNSLNENNWVSVEVEPDSDNDKIDVRWKYEDHTKKVTQVKSSINSITKANIIKWMDEIIKDASDAKEVLLLIIGNCSDSTHSFIKRLNENNLNQSERAEIPSLDSYPGIVNIQQENFNYEGIEAKIITALNKFLTRKGEKLDYFQLETLIGAIVYRFWVFSTKGQCLTKTQFEQMILEWISYMYPGVLKNDYIHNLSFKVAELDYNNMLKINDIIERFTRIDKSIYAKNKVHNAWAFLYDVMDFSEMFVDGIHKELFELFCEKLGEYASILGYAAIPDYRQQDTTNSCKINVFGNEIPLSINKFSDVTMQTIQDTREECLDSWKELKKKVTSHYLAERAAVPYLQ